MLFLVLLKFVTEVEITVFHNGGKQAVLGIVTESENQHLSLKSTDQYLAAKQD